MIVGMKIPKKNIAYIGKRYDRVQPLLTFPQSYVSGRIELGLFAKVVGFNLLHV